MLGKTKLKIFIIAFMALILTFINKETIAYYSTVGKTTNIVTSGNVRLKIHEITDQGITFPKEGLYILPGDIVSKKVFIESDCEQPFYLRVKVVYGINSQKLSAENCFNLNINEEHWELHDGWYYYKGIVEPGQTTPNVFSHVEIVGSKVNNDYLGKTLTLTVKAQAVQSKNNPITDGNTFTASGWPME